MRIVKIKQYNRYAIDTAKHIGKNRDTVGPTLICKEYYGGLSKLPLEELYRNFILEIYYMR